jgi:hypothetical protein
VLAIASIRVAILVDIFMDMESSNAKQVLSTKDNGRWVRRAER